MIKQYTYNDKVFSSEQLVRNAIWENEHKVFGPAPSTKTKAKAFWKALGVIYTEKAAPEPSLETLKAQKLSSLDRAFTQWRQDKAVLVSSLGFTADADERAMIDVSGLVALEAPAVFMDADNTPHELSLEDLKVLQKEIIGSGNSAYQAKWMYREAVNAAEDKESLEAISFVFSPVDFRGTE